MNWPKNEFTRFEVSRIVSSRALQISLGAPKLVDTKHSDPVEIAKDEFKQKKIPITIRRELPSKEKIAINSKKAIENWLKRNNGEI